MKINWRRFWRKTHYWGAIVVAIPLFIVIISGILLQLKKQITWVQPATKRGDATLPLPTFSQILQASQKVSKAKVKSWKDIDRLDVRPGRGIVKVRSKNNWEIQLDFSGKVLQVAYRRSDLIESLHDGSFFHSHAKLWLFLPAAIILLVLWATGIYMFFLPIYVKRKRKLKSGGQ